MSLRVERLVVRRGGRTVISGLDLEAEPGEIVGVVGKNGCGKSTLLMAIAGVLAPTDGRVLVAGHSVWGARRERTRARAALGYVPEGADPPGFLRAAELWALCAAARGVEPPSAALIEQLGRRAFDPWALAGVCVVLAFAGLLACLVPALRAGRTHPMRALRGE